MGTDAIVEAAVKAVTVHPNFGQKFKHPVKFDGTDFVEQRLTAEEQAAEVTKIATTKLHIFLERYGELLRLEDVRALRNIPAAVTDEARFWIERLLLEPLSQAARRKRNRRRRWVWARREMARSNGFFSEDEMKRRDPRRFHSFVGRYIDSNVRLSTPMHGSLSGYLMQQLERESEVGDDGKSTKCVDGAPKQNLRAPSPQQVTEIQTQDEGHQAAMLNHARGDSGAPIAPVEVSQSILDGFDSSPSSDGDGDNEVVDKNASGEKEEPGDPVVRRANFLKTMRDRFVNGQEKDFKYEPIDEDSDLDDIVELGQDAEERYFDAE